MKFCALRSRILLAGVLALAIAGAEVGSAAAFELFGIKLFEREGDDDADVIGVPQRYDVVFVESGDRDVDGPLKGASALWKDRDEPAAGAAGLLAKARGDYRSLLATLYSQGRYGGAISITIDGREAADLPPDSEFAEPASVRITVTPGPVFTLREAAIVNQAPPPVDRDDEVALPRDEGFASGEIARSGAILRAERLSVEAWRQQGHAKAEAAERRVAAAHDADVVDARIHIEPGRRAVYGPTGVRGTERMDPEFVRYMTDLPEGQEYDPDDIKRSTDRLARLDVFRSLRIQEDDRIGPAGELPLSVIVQERALRRVGIGGTFSTIEGLGVETYWLHRNLFGRAERLRLEARMSGINGADPRDYTYRVGATFTKPGVFNPNTDFVTSLIGDREVLDAYTRNGVALEAGLTSRLTDDITGRVLATGRYSLFDDPVFGEREFVSAGVLGGLVFDTRDNPADATEGYFAEFVAEPFYEFTYGNAAASFTLEGRAYYGFGEDDRYIAAARLKLGSLVGPSIGEIAPDRLFLAGGGGSVRGYGYRNIGVIAPGDEIVGGKSLIEGSVELRARFTDTIGAVVFADAGYVDESSFPGLSGDLKVGVGAGLRYITGLGPIRFDVAVPLNPGPADPSVAFYVGIGQAF
ncbi:autotransporter secretion outer membrane protein TamA [Hoeflea marina]|uniref:Autotransporter secretion outer membrane protein TamA n=1 Tax=Hoeflea marina TaxID=274592 RepID=A0A317PBS4_9HYPH|nr:autotransporter assembly complex family protein [Hoeflea marina]PWV95354.1 autotransporter secretion outer membrane protein TamA [Hoeflea marina]